MDRRIGLLRSAERSSTAENRCSTIARATISPEAGSRVTYDVVAAEDDQRQPLTAPIRGRPEPELSALTRQCLDRRISDLDVLNTELAAWQAATNTDQRQVDWQFTTADARIRLRHLYPEH